MISGEFTDSYKDMGQDSYQAADQDRWAGFV